MTKEEILNGMSEAEFYRLYPTRESWEAAQAQMAYGGSPYNPGIPFGAGITMAHGGTYYGGPIYPAAYGAELPMAAFGDANIDYSKATKVTAAPQGYVPDKVEGNKSYFVKPSAKATPSSTPGAAPAPGWEQGVIKRLQAGESPEGLMKAGVFGSEGAKKYAKYYKPVYTETEPKVNQTAGAAAPQKTGIPLKDSDKIDRKQKWTPGNQNQYYDTFEYPDVNHGYSQATTRYFDKKTGQEIDAAKSYDSSGKYVPSFIQSAPGAEGTLKQTRINTPIGSSTDNPVTLAYSSGFKLGGTPYYGGPIIPYAYGGDIVEYCWGGLPGGPNEMPAMMHGGDHYAKYGFNSPTNYGEFSVPMDDGGMFDIGGLTKYQKKGEVNPLYNYPNGKIVDWAKQQQQKLAERTGQGVPIGVSKYYGAFDVPNLSQMDSVVTSPVNPNIGMAFKGSKSMLVPLHKSAEQDVRKINKPFTVATPPKRGERDVYVSYQEFGGAYDTTNAGTYPMMNKGGYGSKIKAKRKTGGDLTSQGGNQSFLDERNSTYLNYIKNNVLNNMHEEESQKVQDAFMQMENQMPQPGMAYGGGYMQMGGYPQQAFDRVNPQNAALQNMYANQINQFQQQHAKDAQGFRDMFGIPQAQDGKSLEPKKGESHSQWAQRNNIPGGGWNGAALANRTWDGSKWVDQSGSSQQSESKNVLDEHGVARTPEYMEQQKQLKTFEQPTHSALLHQLATEFGPSSRRTGLPLFPANVSSYYGINKKDAAKLAGIPQGFKMEGLEITPQWGLGARTAMNIGNWFRGKDEKRTTPGWAPKKIHYKFTGKRGYMPGESQPDENFKQQAARQAQAKQMDNIMKASASQYGPAPEGTTAAPVPYMPAMIKPGYDARGKLLNQKFPGLGPSVIPASSQFSTLAYGGMPEYQGSILGSQTGNPIQLTGTAPATSFIGATPPPTPQSAGLAAPKVVIDESKNTPQVQGPQVMYDATKDRSQEDVTVEGDIKKKWKGVGEAIGQYAVPAMNTLSSILEQKDVRKAKKKLEESMLADNTFMTSPMNAKSRGDYDPNSGMFRPDQMVPVQFPGYAQWGGFNTFADGGSYEEGEELDLSPEEIEELRQQGYEIEYLD